MEMLSRHHASGATPEALFNAARPAAAMIDAFRQPPASS
jgi:hypothetical protein